MWKPLEVRKRTPVSWCVMYTTPETPHTYRTEDVIRHNILAAIVNGNIKELIIYVLKVNSPEVTEKFRSTLAQIDPKMSEKFDELALLV